MKKLFEGILAFKMLRRRQHRGMLHGAGSALRQVHRGKAMLLLSGLAFAAEMWRRHHRSAEQVPQTAE